MKTFRVKMNCLKRRNVTLASGFARVIPYRAYIGTCCDVGT